MQVAAHAPVDGKRDWVRDFLADCVGWYAPEPVDGKRDFWSDCKATLDVWTREVARRRRTARCRECVGWYLLTAAGVMRSGVSSARFKHAASACDFAAHRTEHCRRCLERAIQFYNDSHFKTGDPTIWVNPLSHDSAASTCPLLARSSPAPQRGSPSPSGRSEANEENASDCKQPSHASDAPASDSSGHLAAAASDDPDAADGPVDAGKDAGDELEVCGVCGAAGHSYKTCARKSASADPTQRSLG